VYELLKVFCSLVVRNLNFVREKRSERKFNRIPMMERQKCGYADIMDDLL